MLKKITAAIGLSAIIATAVMAQTPGAAGRGAAAGGPPAGTPTEEQYSKPEVQAYVAKAREIAGNDPDLQYDFGFNCTAAGSHALGGGGAVMTIGDGAEAAGSPIPFVPMSAQTSTLPPQHVFDNLWRFGGSGVGAWLITSDDGYILFDTLNTPEEARDIIVEGMKTVGLDPMQIKYVVIGHNHLDHTGGARYLEQLVNPRFIMGRDDWEIYFRAMASTTGQGARLTDRTPIARGIDAEDGMKITVGDTTVTLISMPGHTPGSTGMIMPAKYQGRTPNILIVTASAGGNNVRNREAFIGGYEHIWNWGLRENVESVLNAHLNYNHNTLSRHIYVTNNYPVANHPMLYGVEKTRKYIEITRACSQARLAALGW